MENAATLNFPTGSIPVILSIQGNATLYTAVPGRRLHIVAMAITTLGGTVFGTASIIVVPKNGTSGTFQCFASGSAGVANAVSIVAADLATETNVTTTLTGTGTSASFSLIGWEEAAVG